MKCLRFALGSLLFLAFFAGASQAQVQRTFVSGFGNDGNPCSHAAPCRTFGTAIGQTNAGGEVIVLDSAGYGPFTITKSVSIIASQGVYAGISVFSADGIDVNAGPGDTVILRGLTVNSQGGANGIVFNSGGKLHIENSVVSGFGNAGIRHLSAGNLFVKDTTARGNLIGIQTSGSGHASMEQLRLDGNLNFGLEVQAGIAAIRNSSMSGNGSTGAFVASDGVALVVLDIDTCLIANNSAGISTGNQNTFVSISNCTITSNIAAGFLIGLSGVIQSRGNNTIIGNGANLGPLTPLTAQ